jgi:putative ABC transport system permease protein
MINGLGQDLRYVWRVMLKSPGFTAIVIITMALGIGANTAIFSVMNAVLLRQLPYREPDRLVMIFLSNPQQNMRRIRLSFADFLGLQANNQSFERVAGYLQAQNGFSLTGRGEPEQVTGTLVTADFFSLLGVTPVLGRAPNVEDGRAGAAQVTMISHEFWQRRFNSDRNIVGQAITLDGENLNVIGVLPKGFRLSHGEVDVWPVAVIPTPRRRGPFILQTMGRLKPGVSAEQAQAEMRNIIRQVQGQFAAGGEVDEVNVISLKEFTVGDIRQTLYVLLGSVLFVLLIALANVANLLLTRATAREREVAIRAALGASRWHLARQFLAESLTLAIIGGAAGIGFALLGLKFLISLSPENIPRLDEIGIDARTLLFTTLITVISGAVFGLIPVVQYSKLNLNEYLKEGERGSTGNSGKHLRKLLVISEFAMALMLVISAGLLINSFMRLQRVNPGFNTENILTMQLSLPQSNYRDGVAINNFYDQLSQRVSSQPGVKSAAVSTTVPPDSLQFSNNFVVEGMQLTGDQKPPVAGQALVSSNYFSAIGAPLLKGRVFESADRADAPPVVIVSNSLARRYFPGGDAVGKRIQRGGPSPNAPWSTIVGVVDDVKYDGLDSSDDMMMYLHYPQVWSRTAYLVVRGSSDPQGLASGVRNGVWSLNKDLSVTKVKTMEQLMYESVAQPRFRTLLLGVFAAVALLLSAVGIYGVMSYSVEQRTSEIGTRMALGAHRSHIMRLILRQSLWLALIGIAIGLGGAALTTHILSTLLYGVSATDPFVFVGASLFLAAVALLASYLPARRATKVDPMVALRYE